MGIEVKITAADATELGASIKGLYQQMFGAPAAPALQTAESPYEAPANPAPVTASPIAVEPPKRGRGRPPKIAEPAVPPVAEQLQESLAETATEIIDAQVQNAAPEPEPVATFTKEDVQKAAIAYVTAKAAADNTGDDHVAKGNAFRALLDLFDVGKISDLAVEQYPAVMAKIAELSAALPKADAS